MVSVITVQLVTTRTVGLNQEVVLNLVQPMIYMFCNNFKITTMNTYIVKAVLIIPESHPYIKVISGRKKPKGTELISQQSPESYSTYGESI